MSGLRSGLDYSHPLHRASVYVEELKYGAVSEDNDFEMVDAAGVVPVLEKLLKAAGLDLDAKQVLIDSHYYGENLTRMTGVPVELSWGVFIDGLMHGIALAAGLEPREPRIAKEVLDDPS